MPLSRLAEQWSLPSDSPLAVMVEERRAAGLPVRDLVTASPQEHGFLFPQEPLAEMVARALAEPTVRFYKPQALGQLPAREAIAAYYCRRGEKADASRVLLTPGTSFGYMLALRLLCEPGDQILIPRPGYPLLDDLAALSGVGLRYYHLRERADLGWEFDVEEVEFQITPRTRAVVVVSPHNPTGCAPTAEQLRRLGEVCRRRGVALLFDEVFCEFLLPGSGPLPRPKGADFPLAITLNGFSKMFSLPQWKVAWLRVEGDEERTGPFLRAAEHLADTFLAVNELAQAIVPDVFDLADPAFTRTFAAEYARRREALCAELPWPAGPPTHGVYVCAKLPEGEHDAQVAERLLREQGTLLHPGFYYDLPGWMVGTAVGL